MEILPAWMIEELEKLREEQKRERERPRLYIQYSPPPPRRVETEEEQIEGPIVIPL